jgi:hypothetical protein
MGGAAQYAENFLRNNYVHDARFGRRIAAKNCTIASAKREMIASTSFCDADARKVALSRPFSESGVNAREQIETDLDALDCTVILRR